MSQAGGSRRATRSAGWRTLRAWMLGPMLAAAASRPIHSVGAAQANFTPQPTATPTPNEVALTFDDGPTPYSSPGALTALEQARIPATVFVEGQYAHQWPNLLKRAWNVGFAIAVHTWDHPLMSKLSTDQMNHQFPDTLAAIHDILGQNACVWLWRPPYGDYNEAVLDMATGYALTTVTWDDNSDDLDRPGVQKMIDNVFSQAYPGAIILMHDGPSFWEQTAAAIPGILDGSRARVLAPVTLPAPASSSGYAVPKANS